MDAIADDVVVRYRGTQEGDLNFILNSWMRSYQTSRKNVRPDLYYVGHQRLIGAIAASCPLVVCCDGSPSREHFIYGWICGEMDHKKQTLILHYIYVKQGYRTVGIAKDLLEAIGWKPGSLIMATHWTPIVSSVASRYNVIFNDYPLLIGNQHAPK